MATTHTVVKGDTLWGIAERYLGSGIKYKQLLAWNSDIKNPDLIYVGQVIKLSDTGSSSTTTSTSSNKPTNVKVGVLSTDDGMLLATWDWSNSNTASYKVLWTYDTGNGVWFIGSNSTITVEDDMSEDLFKYSTYSIPANAKKVKFKVKPISKTYKKNNTETNYWDAQWSNEVTYTNTTPLTAPNTPTVTLDKYTLTATLDNIAIDATGIEFEVVKDNGASAYKTGKATIVSSHASYVWTVDAGSQYKVRCRAYKGSDYSGWTAYSNNMSSIPATPSGITTIRAASETSVYLEWGSVATATSYDVEYATKKEYFDHSDQTTVKTGIKVTKYEISGLEAGHEYFFRVRAINEDVDGDNWSGWTEIKAIVVGKDPSAPTTWSSSTTVISGEPLNLYWVHNSEDGSSQTYAELEITIDGFKETHTIQNSSNEDEKDKTSVYSINTSSFIEGTKIKWRVRTAGVTKVYGEWSTERTIDIYAPPTLELSLTDVNGHSLNVITSFPFYVSGIPGPKTQIPTGYHLSVVSNEIYETTDNKGNEKTVNAGEEVYSKYFDTYESLLVEFSAGNIDLENNVSYRVVCTVSMNSGLTTEESLEFTVAWTDMEYEPNAEIGIDENTFSAYIRPYCEDRSIVNRKVTVSGKSYVITDESLSSVWGEIVPGAKTITGEAVYFGVDTNNDEVYFAKVEVVTPVTNVLLSVYRREFDGSFTELANGLDSAKAITITDPHPSLDLARYRIVAITKDTGAISFYDAPGYPVGGKASIIQWDEAWTNFEVSEDETLEQPPWSGSLLKLPYNIDVSDSNAPDVSLVEYIGREHPVSYYGTQLGHASNWNMEIPKTDKETLYALRRLQRWMGDVYVREPSGSGYWANVKVNFSQKHLDVTIPVTLSISRVEGGV